MIDIIIGVKQGARRRFIDFNLAFKADATKNLGNDPVLKAIAGTGGLGGGPVLVFKI